MLDLKNSRFNNLQFGYQMIKTTPVRGTSDKLDIRLEKKLEKLLMEKMLANNFSQIQTPIIENLDLFVRCVGQSTDVVGKEMFLIESQDHEDRLCLRPEITASTFRAFLNSNVQASPWKVFSSGPVFRHERPQKGRWRQFDQFNIEIVDAQGFEHDVVFIELLNRIFGRTFGQFDYSLNINFLGNSQERANHRKELVLFLNEKSSGLCARCNERIKTNPLRCFDCKSAQCQSLFDSAPMLESFFQAESLVEWENIKKNLTLLGVNFFVDQRLVRGLDYYNGVVFEFKSNLLGAQDTFCGGGRYDLSEAFELKKQVSSIGAGIGVGRLLLILEQASLLPSLDNQDLNLVIPMSIEQRTLAIILAREIAEAGFCTDIMFEDCSFGNMMKKANKLGSTTVLILGHDEQLANNVTIKDMVSGEQKTIKQTEVIGYLKAKTGR